MDPARLHILQTASQVLNDKRPTRDQVAILKDFARVEIPGSAGLPADELATVVALKIMDVYDEALLS